MHCCFIWKLRPYPTLDISRYAVRLNLAKIFVKILPYQVLQNRLLQLRLGCKILIFLSKIFKKSSIKKYYKSSTKAKPFSRCEILYAAKGRKYIQNLNFVTKIYCFFNSTSTRTCRKSDNSLFSFETHQQVEIKAFAIMTESTQWTLLRMLVRRITKENNVYCYRSISNLPAKKAQVLLMAKAICCGTCSVLSVSI